MAKNVLITGGAGFIGSQVCRELVESGYRVRIFDNLHPQVHGPGASFATALRARAETIRGDVRDSDALRGALKGMDAVIHLAAEVGVGQSMYQIREYTDTNNVGTATLLQLLTESPVEKLVVASSMSLYGEGMYEDTDGKRYSSASRNLERLKFRDWEPRDESGRVLRPVPTPEEKRPDLASIYALSKYDQEQMCLLIGRAYRIPTVALRFFNVYGPGQALSNPYTGVMAIFGASLLNSKRPVLFEDGQQKRDFVHVTDVARACRSALEVPSTSGLVLNIGSGREVTIRDVALAMARAFGRDDLVPEVTGKYRVGDIRHCFADIGRAKSVLGYTPRVSLHEGIRDLAGWLRTQHAEDRGEQMRRELQSRGLAI